MDTQIIGYWVEYYNPYQCEDTFWVKDYPDATACDKAVQDHINNLWSEYENVFWQTGGSPVIHSIEKSEANKQFWPLSDIII